MRLRPPSLALVAVSAVLLSAVPGAGPRASSRPFAIGGVIEGFYGTPFTHGDRMDLVAWEASHGLDTYVHAPKLDPYIRAQWREQYPAAQLSEYIEEVRLAARRSTIAPIDDRQSRPGASSEGMARE